MIKYIVLLFNMLGLLIYQAIFTDGVTITQSTPSSVTAGSEFTVELTINKGNIGGFAKLQQDLPAGFTATVIEAKGASFTFSNQSAKFIWTALPGDASFKISYKVSVGADATGDKILAGKFSYIENNTKMTADITPVTVNIGGTPVANNNNNNTNNTAANNTTSNTNTDNTTTNTGSNDTSNTTATNTGSNTTNDNSTNKTSGDNSTATNNEVTITGVNCVRTMPSDDASEFKVEILVKKGNLAGFAKLQETLPAGFTATAGNTNGASFTFAEQKVKLVWVSLPADAEFKVSYNVKVDKAAAGSGPKSITGLFSYIENDETRKFNIPASIIDIKGDGPLANNNTNDNKTTDNGNQNKVSDPTANNNNNTNGNNNTNTTANNTTNNNTGNTGSNDTSASNTNKNNGSTNNNNGNTSASTGMNIPSPQTGVMYRVQLAALQNPKSAAWFNSRFGIQGQVYTEMHEGYTKYTTGSFPMYKGARDERESIKGKGVSDAFVTAYNSGKRITVQEALMITSQQWFR
jgi:hypothetical protein